MKKKALFKGVSRDANGTFSATTNTPRLRCEMMRDWEETENRRFEMQCSHGLVVKVQSRENALSITLIYTPIATVRGRALASERARFLQTHQQQY